ncbi:hypothetical protein TNCV_1583661 [Trichonephila clavipes]|nr:hypothetical protein TNCV_1583661 [Trichonephila clavipes]
MSYPVGLLRVHRVTCGPGLSWWNRVECALQHEQSNRLHNLCDVEVPCQTVVNVDQRHPVIKHYVTPNHVDRSDARCNGLACSVLRVTDIPVNDHHSFTDRKEIHL